MRGVYDLLPVKNRKSVPQSLVLTPRQDVCSTVVPIATQEFSIKVRSEVTWRLRAPVVHRMP